MTTKHFQRPALLMLALAILPVLHASASGQASFVSFDAGPGGTHPVAINASGEITGNYGGGRGLPSFGFVRDTNGQITTITIPSATSVSVAGLNDLGYLTGYYFDSASQIHGFLALKQPGGYKR